jgi:hypothetical protein
MPDYSKLSPKEKIDGYLSYFKNEWMKWCKGITESFLEKTRPNYVEPEHVYSAISRSRLGLQLPAPQLGKEQRASKSILDFDEGQEVLYAIQEASKVIRRGLRWVSRIKTWFMFEGKKVIDSAFRRMPSLSSTKKTQ